ncbi:MAG: SRPBCC family protein [Myxococcota bacterium]
MSATFRVSRTVGAPAERVWTALSTYAEWTQWGVSITEVEAEGVVIRPGARGRVRTRVGIWVPFQITRVEPAHFWTWKVAGVEATGHEVRPSGVGSQVTFTAPWWAAPYALVLRASLKRLAALEPRRSGAR